MDEKKIIENYKKRIQKQNDRIRESYDRISVTLPKGTKDRIQAQGFTINGFVNQLVLDTRTTFIMCGNVVRGFG